MFGNGTSNSRGSLLGLLFRGTLIFADFFARSGFEGWCESCAKFSLILVIQRCLVDCHTLSEDISPTTFLFFVVDSFQNATRFLTNLSLSHIPVLTKVRKSTLNFWIGFICPCVDEVFFLVIVNSLSFHWGQRSEQRL